MQTTVVLTVLTYWKHTARITSDQGRRSCQYQKPSIAYARLEIALKPDHARQQPNRVSDTLATVYRHAGLCFVGTKQLVLGNG